MNLANLSDRQRLIGSIDSEATKARKQWSLRQFEVQSGRIQQYVKEDLEGQYNDESVREMPIVSSINVQKKIVSRKATVYQDSPKRSFTNLNEDQEKVLKLIYKDMKANSKLNLMNKGLIYQDQAIGMIIPKNKKLIMRIFKMHQIDAIPCIDDPETADGYIISTFDRTEYIQEYSEKKQKDTATGIEGRSVRSSASETDGETSEVSNEYQFKMYVQKFIVWTKKWHFMMNGFGQIIDPETGEPNDQIEVENPLASYDLMPFFEVSREKDFEYFVRSANSLTDFTIQFNSRLSDEGNNIKMNGYAIAVLKAPSELQPENQIIGPAMLLKLKTDDPDKEVDFQFASPNSNIGEISQANDKFLNYFITTEEIGGEAINSKGEVQKHASGLDRFLSMLDRTKANKEDYELFKEAEERIFMIIKAWLDVLKSSDSLDKKYKVNLPDDCEIEVEFSRPELVQTETERVMNIRQKLEERLMTRKEAIMELRGVSETKAEEILEQIESEMPSFTIPRIDQGE